MATSCEARDPIWLAEIDEEVGIWRMLADNFANSGEQAILEYLARDHGYTCYASPHGDHWSVQVIGQVAEDRGWEEHLSVYTVGETLLGALSVAAGALEAIRWEGVTYTISAVCQGVIACTV